MKLIKTKKVETITEEIIVEDGTYYFSLGYFGDESYEYYRVKIKSDVDETIFDEVEFTKVRDSYDDYLILSRNGYEDTLPTIAELYFKGESLNDEEKLKTITEEEFFLVKEKVKQKL